MKMEFRTGTHNPYTIYVTGETEAAFEGRGLPGWMRPNEWFIGSLPNESLVRVLVNALNAFVCERCPWSCNDCSLDRSDCGCYQHQRDGEIIDTPISTYGISSNVHALAQAMTVTDTHGSRLAVDVAANLIAALGAQGWRLIHD